MVRCWVSYWVLLSHISSLLLASSMSSEGVSFVTKLIHRDSIISPYYNPNHTIYERAELAITSSIARFSFLSSRERNSSSSESMTRDYQAEVLPEYIGTIFMARMSFGEPPVPQLLVIDTGSTLLWIQCLPCTKCFHQLEQIFDPAKSSTYSNVPCQFPECTNFQWHSCDRMNHCNYHVTYMDSTTSSGFLSFEQLTIGTSDEGLTKIPRVIIGCANENKAILKDGQISGILGLGPKSESLVHKVGKKFSYCLGNIDDLSYPFNQLAMGESARLEGYSTPLYFGSHEYLITLEGISVGNKRLGVSGETFQGGQWVRAGLMIDSGTTYTFLATQGYLALKNEVAGLMEGLLQQVPNLIIGNEYKLELCYKGNMKRDLKGFPVTTFHLAEGVDLVVDIDGMFKKVGKDVFCMAVIEVRESSGLSMLGILAQQYYNVGFDLDDQRIYFERIDCEVLVS
ncbi:hypothetical protein QQ045_014257 [Rhodiola kirilowii]